MPSNAKTKPAAAKTLDFAKLTLAARKERTITFELNGEDCAVRVVPLSAEALEPIEALTDIQPPEKPPAPGGQAQGFGLNFDFDDPAYVARMRLARRHRAAALIDAGCPDLQIPGETLGQKSDAIRAQLPESVVEMLVAAVEEASITRIEVLANFSSASVSAGSRN